MNKAPKAGPRLAGSRCTQYLSTDPLLVAVLSCWPYYLSPFVWEWTQPHRSGVTSLLYIPHLRSRKNNPTTFSQESSRKTVTGPEWVVCLILWSGYGSSVSTRMGVGVGEGVKGMDLQHKKSRDNKNVLDSALKIIGKNYSNLLYHFL